MKYCEKLPHVNISLSDFSQFIGDFCEFKKGMGKGAGRVRNLGSSSTLQFIDDTGQTDLTCGPWFTQLNVQGLNM